MPEQITYQFTYSNGLFLASLLENSVNETSTSLSLYGRGAELYGQGTQQNLINILGSFAFTLPPDNPIVGQHWYDTANGSMTYFNGTSWIGLLDSPAIGSSTSISPGEIAIVNTSGVLQYQTLSGDVSVDAGGLTTITTDSNFTLTGDITAVATQPGKGNLTLATTITDNSVILSKLSNSVREDMFHGKLNNVVNGRQFIAMKVPFTIELISLILHTPSGTLSVNLDYNNVASTGTDMTGLTYTTIASANLINNIMNESSLNTWIAPNQGISLDFSSIIGSIDILDYTLTYRRV